MTDEELAILKEILAELREIKGAIRESARQISQTIETNASL
jgi:hypothetical protein